MTALVNDRNTHRREGGQFSLGVAAATLIYAGGIACRNAAGYAVPGSTATTLRAIGRAEERVDNSAGADGDKDLRVNAGTFKLGNSAAGDLITIADVGNLCYIVDDQTVAKTDGAATRSIAGRIVDVEVNGVWVAMGPEIS